MHELKIQGRDITGEEDGRSRHDVIYITVGGEPNSPVDPTLPVAEAGLAQAVEDADQNNVETVTLDGSGSTDDVGIVSYSWSIDGTEVATGESPELALSVGTYEVALTVTDAHGNEATDTVTVAVNSPYVPGAAIEVVDRGAILAGAAEAQVASFALSKSVAAPCDYLVVAAVSESAEIQGLTYGGAAMVELASVTEEAARIQFFGLANPADWSSRGRL